MDFWDRSADVNHLLLHLSEVDRKISLRDFPGTAAEWQTTERAKEILEQIKTQKHNLRQCNERIDCLKDGLLLSRDIEDNFDSGIMVIVPDLPEGASNHDLRAWCWGRKREYRLKIIDHTWKKLHQQLDPQSERTWASLDGKKLEFRTDHRPSARYLYFHYCVQVLRRSWQQSQDGEGRTILHDEVGKPFWGTPGRYLPQNMLLAFVEELGHQNKDLMMGSRRSSGPPGLLLDVASRQIAARRRRLADYFVESEDGSSDSDSSVHSEL